MLSQQTDHVPSQSLSHRLGNSFRPRKQMQQQYSGTIAKAFRTSAGKNAVFRHAPKKKKFNARAPFAEFNRTYNLKPKIYNSRSVCRWLEWKIKKKTIAKQ